MFYKLFVTIVCFCLLNVCAAQTKDTFAIDTTFVDYEELFSELDDLLDSLTAPRSMAVFNLSVGQGFLTYEGKGTVTTEARKKIIYSPSVGYFHKSGFGVGAGAIMVNDGTALNPYQFSLTGSYDYVKNKSFITGVSFTHFITKDNLSFYTSPLQNEIYGYFTYRKLWFKPSVGFSYEWGSRDNYEEVEEKIQNITLAQKGFTRINTNEKFIDLNLVASIRHDFYFLKTFFSDYIRVTPQIAFTGGSQQFGFNQTSNTYATVRRTGRNILYNTENVTFDNQFYFQPIALTTFLKTEYAKGKFYLQPQLILDYYFPAASDNFSTGFVINAGFVF
jgi:hypothetical protein